MLDEKLLKTLKKCCNIFKKCWKFLIYYYQVDYGKIKNIVRMRFWWVRSSHGETHIGSTLGIRRHSSLRLVSAPLAISFSQSQVAQPFVYLRRRVILPLPPSAICTALPLLSSAGAAALHSLPFLPSTGRATLLPPRPTSSSNYYSSSAAALFVILAGGGPFRLPRGWRAPLRLLISAGEPCARLLLSAPRPSAGVKGPPRVLWKKW
jgi:hypothetical protein